MNTLIILAIVMIAVILLIVHQINQPLTEKIYVTNTYLYILLAVLLVVGVNLILENKNAQFMNEPAKLFAIFILSIISLFIIMFTQNQVVKHVFWVLFILMMGLVVYPIYQSTTMNNSFMKVMLTMIILIALLTAVSYTVPPGSFSSWGSWLLLSLLGVIIFECIDILFGSNFVINHNKIVGWIIIALFSGFILYDTQDLIKTSISVNDSCPSKNQLQCTDYPSQSLALFLDFINLFSGVSMSNQ